MKSKGFTLIEVMIAMLLMAFIAVLILPGITKNAEQQLFSTQLKKVQNDLQQASLIILNKNRNDLTNVFSNPTYMSSSTSGYMEPSDDDTKHNLYFVRAIGTALQNNCIYYADDKNTESNVIINPKEQATAFANRFPHFMNKSDVLYSGQTKTALSHPANFAAINLKNGATVRPVITSTACTNTTNTTITTLSNLSGDTPSPNSGFSNVCGYLEVDLNGVKKPNVVGKDIHFFWIVNTDDGIVPFGENDGFSCETKKLTTTGADETTMGCTYRIIQEGKITYY